MYIPITLYGGKSAQQLSYGFNILDKLEGCPQENQNPYGDMDFSKNFPKVSVSGGILKPDASLARTVPKKGTLTSSSLSTSSPAGCE